MSGCCKLPSWPPQLNAAFFQLCSGLIWGQLVLVILLPSALVNWRRGFKSNKYNSLTWGIQGFQRKLANRGLLPPTIPLTAIYRRLLSLHILDLWKEWRPWCYEHRLSKSLFGLAIGQEGKWTYFTCSMLLIVTDQILSRRGIGSMVSLTFTNYENIVLIKKCLFKECAPLWQYSIAHKL